MMPILFLNFWTNGHGHQCPHLVAPFYAFRNNKEKSVGNSEFKDPLTLEDALVPTVLKMFGVTLSVNMFY